MFILSLSGMRLEIRQLRCVVGLQYLQCFINTSSRLSVTGLYVWCQGCGHGGHVDHMRQWFKNHSYCPTGCLHICKWEQLEVKNNDVNPNAKISFGSDEEKY